MKVNIRKEDQTKGFLRKTTEYSTFVKVDLSPEERDAIDKLRIADHILIEYSYDGMELDWKVSSVVYASDKNTDYRFVSRNAVEREQLVERIKERLSALKSQIEAQMSTGTGDESFEL